MINRFKFHDDEEGRTIHCVVIENPKGNNRIPCVSYGGKFYRVPASMLTHVPEGSPINSDKAFELINLGRSHLKTKREHARNTKEQRVVFDCPYTEALKSIRDILSKTSV